MPTTDRLTTPTKIARLRLLQTTDLHMQILPFDYDRLRPAKDRGLTHLAPHIATLRNEGVPSILVDTGDFLQGNALADQAISAPGPHPMIAAFNEMKFDAVVLGNHDFDYGIPALRKALADLTCPVLAANVAISDHRSLAVPSTIIPAKVGEDTIKVGLFGVTITPSPTVRNPHHPPYVKVSHAKTAAKQAVGDLKRDGADIIVALCHFGIVPEDRYDNIADQIALIEGVDAIFAAHTHDEFPGPDFPSGPGIDPQKGRLHGTPAVMAGAYGRAFGKIDLTLQADQNGWHVVDADCSVIHPPIEPAVHRSPTPGLLQLHDATLKSLRAPITQTLVPLTTSFSMIAPDHCQLLLAQARMARVRLDLAGTVHAERPLIGTAAPYKAGTKDAPALFLTIPPGVVTVQDAHGIFPYRDPVIGLVQTGEEIRFWLEKSAVRFCQITPGVQKQPLIDPTFPPYDFKTLFGLNYQFDLSRPIGDRVVAISFEGANLQPDDTFVVATTPRHRQGRDLSNTSDVLCLTEETSQDVLQDYLRNSGPITQRREPNWGFVPLPETQAQFITTSDADLALAGRNVTPGPAQGDGLQEFTLSFDA